MATWRNGYAEDCKSLYPSSILGVASKLILFLKKKIVLYFFYSSIAQLVEQLTVNQLVAGSSPARGAKKNYAVLDSFLFEIKIFKSLSFSTSVNFPTNASKELSPFTCESKF